MRAVFVAILLVSAVVAAPVGAATVDPAPSDKDTVQFDYTPPGTYTVADLATIYNQNLDAVPGWFRGVLPAGDGAEVVVFVFEDDSMDSTDGVDTFVLEPNADGTIQAVRNPDSVTLDDGGDRLIVSTTASALDAIVVSDDPGAEARQQYTAGAIRLESEGDVTRGVVLWVAGTLDQLGRLFG
jgi:hypothetical protein